MSVHAKMMTVAAAAIRSHDDDRQVMTTTYDDRGRRMTAEKQQITCRSTLKRYIWTNFLNIFSVSDEIGVEVYIL